METPDKAKGKKKKAKRSILAVPWPESHRAALKYTANKIKGGVTEDNAAALARKILEQFMLCVLDSGEIKEFKLVSEMDETIQSPTALQYALEKWAEHKRSTGAKK